MSTRINATPPACAAAAQAASILAVYDFSAVESVADIGGGEGALVAALLQARPHLRALVFDLDSAIAADKRHADESGAALSASGAFFAGIPAGYDLYLLKDVICRWDDRDAIHILRNCRAAMADQSRLLVIESLITADGPPRGNAMPNARSAPNFHRLFAASGLELTRIVPTADALSLIEAVPR
jgi:hypothetical protein